MRSGKLLYIMGPSGSGKDSLLEYAMKNPRVQSGPVRFIARSITRPTTSYGDSGGEKHIPVSVEQFKQQRDNGAFSLYWESHGNHYGIGTELDEWLRKGFVVVVNGSRRAFELALQRYPNLLAVMVTVPPELLRQRLLGRKRESEEEIAFRLRDAARYDSSFPQAIRIDNSGPIEEAGEDFVALLLTLQNWVNPKVEA